MTEESIFPKERKKYHPKEIPSSLAMPITVWYKIGGYDVGEIGAYSFDYNGDKDTIVLAKQLVDLDLNITQDIQQLAVDSLREAIKDVQAEAFKKISQIQQRIDALTQITYQPNEHTPAEDAVADENRQAGDSVLGPDDEIGEPI